MTTLVLLDTCAYLRLAKRIRPFVGLEFGQKPYVITILKAVEDEVHAGAKLKFQYPWFDNVEFATERLAKTMRLSVSDRQNMVIAQGVLHGTVQADLPKYTTEGRTPPGMTDCWVLAFGHVKQAIVVTDDLGMHLLAKESGITVWHGYELLDKLRSAKIASRELIVEIYEALEVNKDMTDTWLEAKHTVFARVFGKDNQSE